jgi:pyruvate dehydrogenase E1 component alpha subunit
MPRKAIKLPDQIDYLSILDESGSLDVALEPKISAPQLMRLFRTMLLERHFDQRLLNLQRQGRIGTFPPISGQEAAHLGAVAVLRPSDWLVPAFRETTAEIWRGRSLESIILFNNGFNEGGAIEPHRNDLPMAIPVGSQIPHAVGIGYGLKYRRTDDVVMVFFGDGATSQGDFHEALNFAAVFQLPVVFVCQNNQWAISIPRAKQTRTATLAQKAMAYGMPGIQVDGNDILAVYVAAEEAVLRARTGDGPTLIESVTYRVTVHTTADDPTRYRSEEEVDRWKARDPLPRFQQYLFDKKLLNAKQLSALEAEVLEEIQTAVDRAEAQMQAPVDPLHMFEHTYAELTPTLREQQQVLADELAASKE